MRIISGLARGRTIIAPKGEQTRPTQDRIREAIFGMIQFEIYGRRVLDMFAGSGGMGLEALSREAKNAVFVDKSREAVACINKNIDNLCFRDRAVVHNLDFEKAAEYYKKTGDRFDIVFLDPPYRKKLCDAALNALVERKLLTPECIVIAEHESKGVPVIPQEFIKTTTRVYGEVAVTILRGVTN